MCGFAGIVDFERAVDPHVAAEMAGLLRHRGPDDADSWSAPGVALAFRRLAIIDLSEGGRQPMTDENGRYRLMFNGELYNYRELRRVLEQSGRRFRSESDTEVVLTAFAEWGPDCVRRFNGMWAFVIWDSEKRSLFASRDRFGIKPLYYTLGRGRLTFASEPKAFRADPLTAFRPDHRAIAAFLARGELEGGTDTFFDGILKVPQAHSLLFDRDGLRLTRYWQLERRDAPSDPAQTVRETFFDALRLHLRSDVRVGSCLSGGVDSSAIVCGIDHLLRTEVESAAPVGERQLTFTAYFDDARFDERPYAQAVVRQTGAGAHWITFDDRRLVDDLPDIVAAQDEPFGSTSIVAQWYVMRAAREAGLKVMLDGQGGDETFGGYRDYFESRFADLLLRRQVRALRNELREFNRLHAARPAQAAATLVKPFLPAAALANLRSRRGGGPLIHRDLDDAGGGVRGGNGAPSPFPDRLRRHLEKLLTSERLPELLRYEDRNSMAHSIEARVPFLDYRLVELAFSLRGEDVIQNGRTKVVLRRALGDLLPPEVRDRTDKLGFVTPEGEWLRGRLGAFAEDVFRSPEARSRGFVDADAALERLDAHRRGDRAAGFELWRALSLELWARASFRG